MMKSIQYVNGGIVISDFGDCELDRRNDGIGELSVSDDEDSCVCVTIFSMPYYQCCCRSKSVVFKLPILTDRNNTNSISMISL